MAWNWLDWSKCQLKVYREFKYRNICIISRVSVIMKEIYIYIFMLLWILTSRYSIKGLCVNCWLAYVTSCCHDDLYSILTLKVLFSMVVLVLSFNLCSTLYSISCTVSAGILTAPCWSYIILHLTYEAHVLIS